MIKHLPSWDTDNVDSLKQFALIELIVLDLDGTLKDKYQDIYTMTFQKLCKSLSHHRYKVGLTIATGRTYHGAKPILDKMLIPNRFPIVLYNGSVVLSQLSNEIILKRTISFKSLNSIVTIASKHKSRVLAYYFHSGIVDSNIIQDVREYVYGWSNIGQIEKEFNLMPIKWFDYSSIDNGNDPCAVLIETSNDKNDSLKLFKNLENLEGISITKSGNQYIEIRPQNSNKATALEAISRMANILPDQVLTLGDNDNDSEMLKWAGIGIAIKDASELAKSNSDYICKYGVARGAIEVLRLVKNAKRYFHPAYAKGHL